MNIDKALKHFKFKLIETDSQGNIKLKTNFKPTLNDLKAYNAILDYKEVEEALYMAKNESLAKLWIHQLILFSRTGLYSGERAIQVIDEILEKDLYQWCLALKDEIPMLRFGAVGHIKYPLEPKDYYNIDKLIERNEKITSEFETELTKELKYTISEEKIIKFVQTQINRILTKYDK